MAFMDRSLSRSVSQSSLQPSVQPAHFPYQLPPTAAAPPSRPSSRSPGTGKVHFPHQLLPPAVTPPSRPSSRSPGHFPHQLPPTAAARPSRPSSRSPETSPTRFPYQQSPLATAATSFPTLAAGSSGVGQYRAPFQPAPERVSIRGTYPANSADSLPPTSGQGWGMGSPASLPTTSPTKDVFSPLNPDVKLDFTRLKKSQEFTVLFSCFGLLLYIFMIVIPVVSAAVLIMDENYRFWLGLRAPIAVIAVSAGTAILFAFTCYLLHKFAHRETVNSRATAVHVIGIHCALFGVLLILISLPASGQLYTMAGRLQHGCQNSVGDSVLLGYYSQVLYNMRELPGCIDLESVEGCDGWSENRYTRYLRYLELEFDCGPLCPDATSHVSLLQRPPGGNRRGAALASLQPASLLQDSNPPTPGSIGVGDYVRLNANATLVRGQFDDVDFVWMSGMERMSGKLYRVLEVQEGGIVGLPSPDGSQNGVWYFPMIALHSAHGPLEHGELGTIHATAIKLFSHGTTSMACMPLVQTRLRMLGGSFGDLIFWEGIAMILFSLVASSFHWWLAFSQGRWILKT